MHKRALQHGCVRCGRRKLVRTGWSERPESPCSVCGSRDKIALEVPQSDGYTEYVRIFQQARWKPEALSRNALNRLRVKVARLRLGASRPTIYDFFQVRGDKSIALQNALGCGTLTAAEVEALHCGQYFGPRPTAYIAGFAYLKWVLRSAVN